MSKPDGVRMPRSYALTGEDAVIELARGGDMAAFEELIRRRQAPLRALLRRLCNDAALADDLSQETFVRAWQALPSLRNNAAFWSWLRRIAARTWAQHLKRQRLRFVDTFVHVEDSDDHAIALFSDAPQDCDRRDLDTALARLAPAARACMVLAYQAGMSHSEIADAIGLPLGSVKTHINRSTRALRQWFGVEQSE